MSIASVIFQLATPSPAPTIPSEDVTTPGVWGFVAVFGVALVVCLLIIDMTRRIRRVRYRAEVAEKLDAEQRDSTEESDQP
jgi:hypothetical protein